MKPEDLYNVLLQTRLAFPDQSVEQFMQMLKTLGGERIGSGVFKTAFMVQGVIVKFGSYAWDNRQVTEAMLEAQAPVSAQHLVPETHGDQGIIVQEAASVVASVIRDSDPTKYRQAQDAMYHAIWEAGGVAGDLHDGNWGLREDGTPVVFDGGIKWTGMSKQGQCACSPCIEERRLRLTQARFDDDVEKHYNRKEDFHDTWFCVICKQEQQNKNALRNLMRYRRVNSCGVTDCSIC